MIVAKHDILFTSQMPMTNEPKTQTNFLKEQKIDYNEIDK